MAGLPPWLSSLPGQFRNLWRKYWPTQQQNPAPSDAAPATALNADQPIEAPAQDLFDLDPFALAIATSIARLHIPEGVVIGIHGPWGSGKSSAVNLIKHHLRSGVVDHSDQIEIVDFSPWWFGGADTLALAFFREMGSAIGKTLSRKAKKAFQSLGRRISAAGNLVGAAVDLATGGVAGTITRSAASYLGDVLNADRTVVQEHAVLAKALREQQKRFLVIIDDIDRLNPDEVLLVFKLIKSVGRLPNVIYLLAFDRQLAEKAIEERFPSEGPHYLEKIIQASFEIPVASREDLLEALSTRLEQLVGRPPASDIVRFMNLFYDAVAPFIKTPRDAITLMNALQVTWPTVAEEVDRGDFIAIEALRLFRPTVYQTARDSTEIVCDLGAAAGNGRNREEECNTRFLNIIEETDRPTVRTALMRLFPALEGAWNNHGYGDGFVEKWRRKRLVCSKSHFQTYFRFSVGTDTLPAAEVDRLLQNSGNRQAVIQTLRTAAGARRRHGGTRAALFLDELNLRQAQVPAGNIGPLVSALFEIADELNVDEDRARGFSIGSNDLRIHWLLNRMVADRLDEPTRDQLLCEASQTAALGWLVSFVDRCINQHKPPERGQEADRQTFLTREATDRLHALALGRLRQAGANDQLIHHKDLVSLLFRWRDLEGENGPQIVRQWTAGQLDNGDAVVALAGGFISASWSQGMGIAGLGDRVALRREQVNREDVDKLIDFEPFHARIAELLAQPDLPDQSREKLSAFNAALARQNDDRAHRAD